MQRNVKVNIMTSHSDVIPCAVIMDKQNAIVCQQMTFKQFEHSQVYNTFVQGNNTDFFYPIMHWYLFKTNRSK